MVHAALELSSILLQAIHSGQLLSLGLFFTSVPWFMLHCGGRPAQSWAPLYPLIDVSHVYCSDNFVY